MGWDIERSIRAYNLDHRAEWGFESTIKLRMDSILKSHLPDERIIGSPDL
ncbi:MAG: hypothetical protein IPN58_01170 [Anaerolineales bacterium]|nr:hypothetical protein [Anaerolineales bacterium]